MFSAIVTHKVNKYSKIVREMNKQVNRHFSVGIWLETLGND